MTVWNVAFDGEGIISLSHDRYSVAMDDVVYYDMIVTVWP